MSRLLVVEDEQHLAEGLRFNLVAEHHDVEVVDTGEGALALLKADRFDLVILDVMLPGINGFDVAAELRRAGQFVPVLMLTARGRPEDVLRGFQSGADDYLPKPFAFDEFRVDQNQHFAALAAHAQVDHAQAEGFAHLRRGETSAGLVLLPPISQSVPEIVRDGVKREQGRTATGAPIKLSTSERALHLKARELLSGEIEVARGTRDVWPPEREEKRSLEREASALLGPQPVQEPLVDVSNQQALEAVVLLLRHS